MGSLRERKVTKMETPYVNQQISKVQASSKKRKGLFRRLVFFGTFAVALSVLAVSTLISQAAVLDEKEKQKATLEKELTKLEKKQTLLEEEIIKLNDDEYIAKIARRDYFLSNKGEIIFNLPKSDED
ncbi:FtsB family cell division protein [Peribacillus alkalitolerans]|uniref:FtsB family cell division protein n=1 Tax=Peribacillus alkalitolerans TaxID=1550385 RepID=UPI0013D4DC0E|nr:septum formation initiator family protein [Peribacillus alkalitolerans]